MAKKNLKGIFITFEGPEGSGKSTQSKLLFRFLRARGYKAVFLREPGGTRVSEKIRRILLDRRNDSMTAQSEMLLYMAARAQLVREVILPALSRGEIVVCDRFLDSTRAYQGFGLGLDLHLINAVGNFVTAGLRPALTILLDLPVEKGLRHRAANRDRIEKRAFAYHACVRRAYHILARREPGRFKIVKVNKDRDVTQAKIRTIALGILKRKRKL